MRRQGIKIIYDRNYRLNLWESRKAAQDVTTQMWRRTDIALPSIDDEMVLFGDKDMDQVLARLRQLGCKNGALKMGAKGPVALSGEAEPIGTFSPATQVIDTTAAGDSINAGNVAAILLGQTNLQAMQASHALSCQVIQQRGAIAPAASDRQ